MLTDLVLLSRFHRTWNFRPAGKESQEYNNWTVKLMKEAKESQADPEMSRNIQAGAKYLGVSCIFQLWIHLSIVDSP